MEPRRTPVAIWTVLLGALLMIALTACGSAPPPSASASRAPVDVASLFPEEPSASPSTASLPSADAVTPLGADGSVVVLGTDLSLSIVASDGRTSQLATVADGTFTFPAWSPDGRRIAAIRYGTGIQSILVFDAAGTSDPVVLLESPDIGPFYLSWSPDGRSLSYLASQADLLSLRVAPVDGTAPVDGSGDQSIVGSGSPFYFDWIGSDRMLAHVGSGPEALLGEIGLDGTADDPVLGAPGEFRSAVVSPDGSLVSFVQVDADGGSEVVVATRDGSEPQSVPVFGPAAMTFDPTGVDVATIGAIEPMASPLTIPVGPLRLLERATGAERTLLDEVVVSFWWSPDGATIAALSARPSGSASEIHLIFLDVASGAVLSDTVVMPGRVFIDQVLTYFDQYALSHRLWSPDSAAFLLPVGDADGGTQIAVLGPDGRDPVLLPGQAAFWSP